MWEGFDFSIIPSCVQYVAVRPPPGPRSAGFNPAAAGGRYDRRQPAVSDYGRRQGLIPQSWPLAEHQGATPFRRPLGDQLAFGLILLERGAIFRHVAFKLPSSCHLVGHLRPSCLQDGSKTGQDRNLTPTWAQLGPSWPHLGPILAPSWQQK